MTTLRPILLVEDNPDDVFFMKRAIAAAQIPNPLHIVTDGQQAIDYLERIGSAGSGSLPLPLLVLLDLKLPKRNGLEVLQWVRKRPHLRRVVVIMLTTSREDGDISSAYETGCNSFLVKPASPPQLAEVMRAVKSFWLELNVFPES